MKGKLIFLTGVILYVTAGFTGLFFNGYTEEESKSRFLSSYIVLLVIAAVLIGGMVFYFFRKVFPNGYKRQNLLGKIAIPLVFCLFAFGLNRGICFVINASFGKQQKFWVQGYVMSKYYEKSSKGSKSYYIVLSDTGRNKSYTFRVSRDTYTLSADEGGQISKEFTIGSLGIIYRTAL
jgi:hypothetical protein